MGKKKLPRQWIVHLETTYRGDRNERIAKAFALVLPIISRKPRSNIAKEENEENESSRPQRHLCSRLK